MEVPTQFFHVVQDYTHVVMNFLLTGRVGPDRNEDWLEYFDVVITGKVPFLCRCTTLFAVMGPFSLQHLRRTMSIGTLVPAGCRRLGFKSLNPCPFKLLLKLPCWQIESLVVLLVRLCWVP